MRQEDRYARLKGDTCFSLGGHLPGAFESAIYVSAGTVVLVERLTSDRFRIATLDRPDYFCTIGPEHFEYWISFMTPLEVLALELG